MAKKLVSRIIVALTTIFVGMSGVNAAGCTYQQKADLNETAQKVKTSYEVVEKIEKVVETNPDDINDKVTVERKIPEFKISIYNITEDIYISQTDSVTKKTKNIYPTETTNGVYTFTTGDLDNITTYTYKILSNVEGCRGDSLRSYTFVKPMANPYAQYGACQGLEDIPYCKPFVTKPVGVSLDNLGKAIEDYLKDTSIPSSRDDEDKTFWDFVKDNYIYIIIGVVLVGGVAGGTIYFIRKRSAL